jgi:hypothetical protein
MNNTSLPGTVKLFINSPPNGRPNAVIDVGHTRACLKFTVGSPSDRATVTAAALDANRRPTDPC